MNHPQELVATCSGWCSSLHRKRTRFLGRLLVVAWMAFGISASAQTLLHYWNFNNTANLLGPTVTPSGTPATLTVQVSGTAAAASDTGQGFAAANAQNGDAALTHLRINNPTNTTGSATLFLKAPTTGYRNVVLKYETRRSTQGAAIQQIDYTTDGTTYTAFQTLTVADANPVVTTLDFSSLVAVENNANFGIRIKFVQSAAQIAAVPPGGLTGNNRFDNITVSGTLIPVVVENTAPTISAVGNRTVDELSTLKVVLAAVDTDIPAQTLTFSKVSGPSALTVSDTGILLWTPTLDDGPGSYPVTVRVTDNGSPAKNAETTFTVTVAELLPLIHAWNFNDTSSVATLLTPSTTVAGAPATMTASPESSPTYAADVTFSAATDQGVFGWNRISGEPVGAHLRINNPLTPYTLRMNLPTYGYRNIIVKYETRRSTTGAGIQQIDYTTDGTAFIPFQTVTVQDVGSTGDVPVVALDFSSIPAVENNPKFGIRISFAQGAGSPGLVGNNRFDNLTVRGIALPPPPNTAPTVGGVEDQTVDELATLKVKVSAVDTDIPSQSLTFSKVTGPAGLTVSATGMVQWTPTLDDGPNSYPVTVRVTDNGTPPLSAETSFAVHVTELLPLVHAWNFNDTTSVATLLTPSATLAGAPATLTVSPDSSPSYALDVLASTALDQGVFGGNGVAGDPVGAHLRINNPLTPYTLTLKIPTSGYRNILVKYETRRSGTGAGIQQVDYTTDGTTYIPFQTVTVQDVIPTADVPVVFLDFSAIPAVENNPNFGIRISFEQGAGSPGLTGNNRFDNVTVRGIALPPPPNTDPTISTVADQTVDELATLKVSLSAVDTDIPGQTLTFSKVSGPAGLTVSASGLVQWTPTLDDGSNSYPVTVRVTDNGTPPKSAETSFTVHVAELLPLVHAWNFNDTTSVATLLTPSATIAAAPAKMTVIPTSAELAPNFASDITFSTSTDQGVFGGNAVAGEPVGAHLRINNPLTPYVVQMGVPTPGYRNVIVKYETRRSGTGAGTQQIDYTVDGATYVPFQTVTVLDVAADADVPVVTLDFSGVPAVEDNRNFGLRISFAQGAGDAGLTGNNRFDNLTVRGIALPSSTVNHPPQLGAVPDASVEELSQLKFNLSAVDTDIPAQSWSFSKVSGPAGLTVSPAGLVQWTPTLDDGPNSYQVTVRVTDDGTPPASAETTFTVVVTELFPLVHAWNFNDTGSVAALLTPSVTLPGLPASMTVTPESSPDYAADITFSAAVDQGHFGGNGVFGDPVGAHLRVNNPIAPVPYTITSRIPTSGFRHIVVKYETRRSTQGAGVQEVAYTLDGLNYTPFQTVAVQDVDGSANVPVVVLDFTGIPAVENNPNFGIQITFAEGSGGTGGNNRFDNVTVRGIALPPPPENTAPSFVAVADQTLDELTPLSVQLEAVDTDLPAQTLQFSRVDGPVGLTVSGTGLVEWTPPATAGPGVYDVRVRVTDNGIPAKSSETTFKVTVNDVLPVTRIRINEVMSSNFETLADFEGDPEDWIEFVNPTADPINLAGAGLTDDPTLPFKWTFPAITIAPGGYLVVFASEQDLRTVGPGLSLHTNFKISSGGETLVLTAPGGGTVDQIVVPALTKDVSFGRLSPSGSSLRYFKPATPGSANIGPGFEGIMPKPSLTVNPGYFATPVAVNATLNGASGATLRFTTNGNDPTDSSAELTAPITFQSRVGEPNLWADIPTASDAGRFGPGDWGWNGGPSTETYKINTFRVRAFKEGFIPSEIATGSYIVDPNGASRYKLPVVSIVGDYSSFFDPARGLFVPFNYRFEGNAWERPAHLELFENATLGVSQDIGFRINGAASVEAPLKSLRIYARSQYGASSIDYPIFRGHPNNHHERLILRNGGSLGGGEAHGYVQFRDAFAQYLVKDISQLTIQYDRPVAVFINGEYWGLESLREHYDNNYLSIQYGVDNVDLLEATGTPIEGTNTTYLELVDYLTREDLNQPGRYDWVRARMDVENFRDYYITQSFHMNYDQPGKNFKMWRSQTVDPSNPRADGRWRWLLYDLDLTFGLDPTCSYQRNALIWNTGLTNIASTTVIGPTPPPDWAVNSPERTLMLRKLLLNQEFRQDFVVRFADLLNTVFTTAYMQARLSEFKAEVEPYMPEHIARWRLPATMTAWQGSITGMEVYAQQRPGYMWDHLRTYFNLSNRQTLALNLGTAGAGKFKVNTVTIGPGEPGVEGTAFPWSGSYFPEFPVQVTALPENGFLFSHWTGDVPAGSETSPSLSLSMTAGRSLTAHFVPGPRRVLRDYWSFNHSDALLLPDVFSGNASISIDPGASSAFLASTGQNFSGLNAQLGEEAGTHLRVNSPIGATVTLRLPTTGIRDPEVRYETRRSGQGAGTQQIDYTVDGTTFLPFRTLTVLDADPQLVFLDFTGVAGTANNPDFALRITFSKGAGGTAGNNRFDNLTVHGMTLEGFYEASPAVLSPVPLLYAGVNYPFQYTLTASDADGSTDSLVFSLVSGPAGLTVNGGGLVEWTPGAALLGTTNSVVVRVQDGSSLVLGTLGQFQIVVRDANHAPVLNPVGDQLVNELDTLAINLTANDADLPLDLLTYSLVNGPAGLSVTPAGILRWTPTAGQGPGIYTAEVRVTDNGVPPMSSSQSFQITVGEPGDAARRVWQIGVDDNPAVPPYDPSREFSPENRANDPAPGAVTRLPGDPLYVLATNPTADDDFYTAGRYPAGFNGLTGMLTVPNDEPSTAWERAHTQRDTTNRIHFDFVNDRVRPGAEFRLTLEFASGGYMVNGVLQPGFANHDMVIRFRNGAGVATDLYSQRISQRTTVDLTFTAASVGALPGANTIEFVRTGPVDNAFTSYWIVYDYVRLESGMGNTAPVLASVANQTVDELTPLVVNLTATDTDVPAQTLTYELVSGPLGMSVSAGGQLNWTPTEAQGPGVYTVTVSVKDNGVPVKSDTKTFSVTVNDVNSAPVLAGVADRTMDELTPMVLTLSATDTDVPVQTLTYEKVSGPDGLVVSAGGQVSWTPTEAQGPGVYTVVVQVKDDGSPVKSDTKSFVVTVNEVPDPVALRTVWQIGTDNNPAVLPYNPSGEFSVENRLNDPAPGKVTRLAGDPLYVAATNPTADDDFYTAGQYPAGFNRLTTPLVVPNDEPAIAWERAHTRGDVTNRMHFVVDPSQAVAGANYRLSLELVSGGSMSNGVPVSGFADHDMVVRVRNGTGAVTELLSRRVSQATLLVVDFPGSVLTGGANTIEIARTGPNVLTSYWIQYDFLRLEMLGGATVTSGVAALGSAPSVMSQARVAAAAARYSAPQSSTASGAETDSGAADSVNPAQIGVVVVTGLPYRTLTYTRRDPAPVGVRYIVEGSSDAWTWSERGLLATGYEPGEGSVAITVRDSVPLTEVPSRVLRLRLEQESGGGSADGSTDY
ncbi:MAG: putative Ig domain-containing protein [Verrucomicrobiota bacterium]